MDHDLCLFQVFNNNNKDETLTCIDRSMPECKNLRVNEINLLNFTVNQIQKYFSLLYMHKPSSDELQLTLKTLDLFPTMKDGKIMQCCFSELIEIRA